MKSVYIVLAEINAFGLVNFEKSVRNAISLAFGSDEGGSDRKYGMTSLLFCSARTEHVVNADSKRVSYEFKSNLADVIWSCARDQSYAGRPTEW